MREQRYHGLRIAFLAATTVALGWWWWRNRPFAVAVQGASMSPTLVDGDLLLATVPVAGAVAPGSLVVVEHPDRPGYEIVKRVIRTIGPTAVWVEGDNEAASSDSRTFGAVGLEAVRGVVRLRYWPVGRASLL